MKLHSIHFLAIFLIIIICNKSQVVFSKDVNINTAKNVALNLYAERAENPKSNIGISQIIEQKEKGETVFYTVIYSEKGFALISADDVVKPVLGYSFDCNWDEDNHSPGFEFFVLQRFKKQIYDSKHTIAQADESISAEWNRLSHNPQNFSPKTNKSFVPLLSTVWRQGWPYNGLCPTDPAGPSGHALVGCTAVAMAQVLNYWQHPWHGTGSYSYTPESHPEYGEQSADFANTYYNFDNMPDTATEYSEDLAELMYHCAVSVDMDFGPTGSGAWGWGENDVRDALQSYFYFDEAGNDLNRSSYTTSAWVDKMKENLDVNRPVIYGGTDIDNEAGHTWVLDAYSGDLFHCNWGWGGQDNGWYSIDDFSPDIQNQYYDNYHSASVNIYPKDTHVSGTWDLAGSPYNLNYNYIVDEGNHLIIEPGVVVNLTGRYKLEVNGRITAVGSETDTIKFTSDQPEIGTRGVRIYNTNNTGADSSKLVFCHFEHGKGERNAVEGAGGIKGGSIYCQNSSKVLIENCKIENSSAGYGGGIACYDTSNVRIKNCIIQYDSATMGGGIYLWHSNVLLSNNYIFENEASSNGGGIYGYKSDAILYKDTIKENHAHFGGGMGFGYSWPIFDSLTLSNNEAISDGGGIYSAESNLDINNSMINNNWCQGYGGAFLCYMNSNLNVSNSILHNNLSDEGAVTAMFSAHAYFFNSTIARNYTYFDKSANYVDNGSLSFSNSISWNNTLTEIDTSGSCTIIPEYSIIKGEIWEGTEVVNLDPMFEDPLINNYNLTWPDYPIPDGEKSPAIDSGDPSSPDDPDGTRADMGAIPYEQTYTTISGGTINGTLSCAESPYYVFGNLEVPVTDELIIEPCVTVIFQGYYILDVKGRLHAVGTDSQQITFAAADTLEGWKGIWFKNTQSNGLDSSKLVHCRVTFGYSHGSQVNADRGGAAFFSNGSNVLVKNCLFNKNRASSLGGAIYVTGTYSPVIANNIFENNYAPNGGAILGLYTNLILSNNIFQNNNADKGGAIYCHTSSFTFEGNTIRNNRAEQFGGGIYFEVGGTHTFDPVNKNSIYLNYAAAAGLDLFSTQSGSTKNVIVDTFTVQNPNKHFTWPLDKFTFSIDNHIIEQADSDLWVSMTGDDDNTGTSEADPLKTMYMACLKIMADETNPHTIYLADGTYSEGATNEVFPINWRSYVSMKGKSIDGTSIYGENKNQLLYCWDDSGFSIDSLTFQGGYGEYGGGIRLENESSPTVSDIEVMNNFALEDGGGIYCKDECNPVFENIDVHDNTCDVDGGGIKLNNYCNATILNSEFYDNFALYRGGGINVSFYSDVIMDSLLVAYNTAVHGGGISFYWDSDAQLNNSTITNNNALSHVMGYFGTGGGIWTSYNSDPILKNIDITHNHADYRGGGINVSGGNQSKTYDCFIDNNTSKSAGGLYLSGDGHYYNTIISNNTATDGFGGGIYTYGSDPVLTNITVVNNTVVSTSSYIYNGGAVYNYNSNPVFKNSILWENSPNEFEVVSGSPSVEYCNIEGSFAGTGNIDSDPQFINDNFDIGSESPCTHTGSLDTTGMNIPSLDYSGNPRIAGGKIDIGAYEYQGPWETYELYLTVFLEGPYNGIDMNTDLYDIPLEQPYNTAPWNYPGEESVSSIPPDVVDWVLVEIRMGYYPENATPEKMIDRQAAFLLSDGSVVALDGIGPLEIIEFPVDSLQRVIVWHRNHLGIISNWAYNSVGMINGIFSLTTEPNVHNSEIGGLTELQGGMMGMVAGDANSDGTIDILDKNLWGTEVGESQYLNSDFNLDGQINNNDKNDFWQINMNDSSQVPN